MNCDNLIFLLSGVDKVISVKINNNYIIMSIIRHVSIFYMYITIIYLFISQFLDEHEITSHATRNRGGGGGS